MKVKGVLSLQTINERALKKSTLLQSGNVIYGKIEQKLFK